jgi:hypothetical protein
VWSSWVELLQREALGKGARPRDAEAGTRVPAAVAAAAAGVDLVARWDLPCGWAHALRPAPQPEGAVPAARHSE